MRAPFQVLVIPYCIDETGLTFAALRRSDDGHWQGVAGGGEDDETPLQAAIRECKEEVGVGSRRRIRTLQTRGSVSVEHFSGRDHWPLDTLVIPEYCFALQCSGKNLALSAEHTEVRWGAYESIRALLYWDTNKTALWEVNRRFSRT